MCMFLLVFYDTEGLPPVSGGSCVGVFWALAPSLVCFAVVSCGRNANLAGGFACRRCWWFFCSVFFVSRFAACIMEQRRFMMNFLIYLLAYPNVRTKPQSDIGRNRGKNKKKAVRFS